ncbi:MAG: hypothetical protein ACOH2J_08260 [Allorhizobium sp.]
MSLLTWSIIFLAVVVFAYFATRMTKQTEEGGLSDTGIAILDFGRAFPNEAIRSLHTTADKQAIFVRLHDNKAGLMRSMRGHYACYLIEPGSVRVQELDNGRGFAISFLDAPFHDGDYSFATAAEAAEVSLWLLGNFVRHADMDPQAGRAGG